MSLQSPEKQQPPEKGGGGFLGFWTTLPGVLTGIAGVLTAAGAIVAIIIGTGGPGTATSNGQGGGQVHSSPHDKWVSRANGICQEVNAQNLPVYNPGDLPQDRFNELQTASSQGIQLDQRLRALPPAPDDAGQIGRMLDLWDQVARDFGVAASYLQQGNTAGELAAVRAADGPNNQANDIANGLGVGDCASARL